QHVQPLVILGHSSQLMMVLNRSLQACVWTRPALMVSRNGCAPSAQGYHMDVSAAPGIPWLLRLNWPLGRDATKPVDETSPPPITKCLQVFGTTQPNFQRQTANLVGVRLKVDINFAIVANKLGKCIISKPCPKSRRRLPLCTILTVLG